MELSAREAYERVYMNVSGGSIVILLCYPLVNPFIICGKGLICVGAYTHGSYEESVENLAYFLVSIVWGHTIVSIHIMT